MKPSGDHLIISCLFRASLNALEFLSFFSSIDVVCFMFSFLFCDSFVLQWSDGGAGVKPCHKNHVEICEAPADGTDPLCPRLTCCQTDHQKCESFDLLYTDCLRTCVGWRGKQPTTSATSFFLWKQFAHVIAVGVDTCWSNPLGGQQSRTAWLQKRNQADWLWWLPRRQLVPVFAVLFKLCSSALKSRDQAPLCFLSGPTI